MEPEPSFTGFKVAPRKKIPAGRVGRSCALVGCGVKLSRYNPGDFCGIHTPVDHRIPPRR